MTVEGKVSIGGSETWYRVVGDPPGPRTRRLPVLALLGGPSLPHESLEPLEDVGRQVVFYDQLGCGYSTRAGDPDPWGADPFLEELAAVRRELGLARVHLLGHSWGGMLAMEHALGGAGGIASLILVGAVVSGPMVFECLRRFYEKLPPDAREVIHGNEAAGTFDDPEYAEAMDLFYRRYACRLDPWPGWLNRALSKMDVEANAAMWGPPGAPGPLATPDLRPRLGGTGEPALVVAGRHDGMTSGQEGEIQAGIPGSKLTIFEESSPTRSPKSANASSPRSTASSPVRSAGRGRRPSPHPDVSFVVRLAFVSCYLVGPQRVTEEERWKQEQRSPSRPRSRSASRPWTWRARRRARSSSR